MASCLRAKMETKRIGLVDADLLGRKKHRFPNLAIMKLSSCWKSQGFQTELVGSYDDLSAYEKVFVSKVFTDTPFPEEVASLPNVITGGTGFRYDKAEPLPYEIEHSMPDYDLYNGFVNGIGRSAATKFYTDYSIGFLTRGCFRKCSFCVNKGYERCELHSPLDEFLDMSRKKICLLDDNFLACPQWGGVLRELMDTGKPFVFKQGLDERLLTDEKCELLFNSKYDGEFIFAFDDLRDHAVIREKLNMIRRHTDKPCMFYVLCGYDREGIYDDAFWVQDINGVFERIELLREYGCFPYIMRYKAFEQSPYRGMYVNLARWCNQRSMFKKLSFREFCEHPDHIGKATQRYFEQFMHANPRYIAQRHVNAKWGE